MNQSQSSRYDNIQYENALNVPAVIFDTERIKSVELFRVQRGNVPALRLTSADKLTLNFDEISDETNIFRVKITHHNADWTESTVLSNFFETGFSEDTIVNGTPSVIGDISYFSYSYSFPNRDFGMRISGNYLLHVLDYNSGDTLFSLPFIVYEDRGALRVSIEDVYDFSAIPYHQIFATYQYPDFILIPQSDLTFHYVQNQNWGRYQVPSEMDASTQGEIRKHQQRDEAFTARYEFRSLDINSIYSPGSDVLEVLPERKPPLIRMQYDVVDLDINPRQSRSYRFGDPLNDRKARYIQVEFNLDRPNWIHSETPIYVVGPFNNWQISESYRMSYIRESDAFRASPLIKEGRYDYKYVTIENNKINDLSLDAFFASTRQYYQVIVYFHDQQEGYDRVLQFTNIQR